MFHPDTEILFPLRVIPSLASVRGEIWHELVRRVIATESGEVEHLGFSLMMVRLNGCVACNADSFRAMRGCTLCAELALRRFRGTDSDLLKQFEEACRDVRKHLNGHGA